ncbi:SPFH domain-containing protein [Humibacter ginsenosidimutans]|nr:SPFH domain-containing protein [Humibacter ginsenosidimutans]
MDTVPQRPDAAPFTHSGARVDIEERSARCVGGGWGVLAIAVLLAIGIALVSAGQARLIVFPVVVIVLLIILVLRSLVIVQPGETRVVQLFGRYVGTVRRPGMSWVVPFSTRRKVSVRIRNFETKRLRVNDADGNPVELAAIVVWQVSDTAKATYAVDDYLDFVMVQAESALRQIATAYPYDASGGEGISLRDSTDVVATELSHEVTTRVAPAGIEIVEVRISHLAYAPEIAQAMLRRQQAGAVVQARSRIVEGAVGMVEMALDRLNESDYVTLDDERRAAMVSNLMVVLCSDQPAAPIVNAGTLYS